MNRRLRTCLRCNRRLSGLMLIPVNILRSTPCTNSIHYSLPVAPYGGDRTVGARGKGNGPHALRSRFEVLGKQFNRRHAIRYQPFLVSQE